MPLQHAKVRLNAAGRGTVELDGHVIPGARKVTVLSEAGSQPVLVIEVVAATLDFQQGDAPDPVEELPDAAPS